MRKSFTIKHYGVLTPENTVVHASKEHGYVVESSLEKFADRGNIHLAPLSPRISEERIRENVNQMLGQPYNLLKRNCEHVARFITGNAKKSPQLRKAGAALAVGLAFFILPKLASRRSG